MKIGFVVHFFDFRNDVRKVIEKINQHHEVVLFVRKADQALIRQYMPQVEIREVQEQKKSLKNRFWDTLFRFFGKLPKSIRNYYLMECFKISLSDQSVNQKKASFLLNVSMKMPRFVSYDTYLNSISYQSKTSIQDIDQFICFTDISDSYFFARLIREQKNVKVYVYSWDHPCKHTRYSKKARYLVWHGGIQQDLESLQAIASDKIRIVGASQFAYIHQFLSTPSLPRTFEFDYIYFGCAIGIPALVEQEARVIRQISELLGKIQPQWKVVVRPYPVLTDWAYYEALKQLPNVVFDDQFRAKNLSVGEQQIMEKYEKIQNARAFVHLGTTMGLEACFIATPSLILDFPEFVTHGSVLSVHNFVHQFQNEKYLINKPAPNVVKSIAELEHIFRLLTDGKDALLPYNQQVASDIPLKSFEQFARDLVEA